MPKNGDVGGGSAQSLANNSAAKDDYLTTPTFTQKDLLANDPGSARNFTFLDDHVTPNADGTFSLKDGFTSFDYKIQLGNGTWSTAHVTQLGHFAQLLANPSFEADAAAVQPGWYASFQSIAGWTNEGLPLEIVSKGYCGIGGDGHWLDTQSSPGGVTISQPVTDHAGTTYTLSFSVADESIAGLHPASALTFSWNGAPVATITEANFADVGPNQFKTFSFEVTATGHDTLTIHDDGIGYVGYALDSVTLTGWVV